MDQVGLRLRGVKLKFCIEIGSNALIDSSPMGLVQRVKQAEEAGVDSVWVSENPFHWDAYAVLGSLSMQTSKLKLGTGVSSPYVRPPHLQAMSAVTLDRLSQGRAFLGLGRGLVQWYRSFLGLNVGDPVSVMEETIDLVRQWWNEPYHASSEGYFRVPGLRRAVGGVQSDLPIYIAAVGPRMVRLAARVADGVVFTWPSPQFLEETIKVIYKEMACVGRNPNNFSIVVNTGLQVTDEPEKVLEQLKGRMASIHSLPGMDTALLSSKFDVPRIVSDVRDVLDIRNTLEKGGSLQELNQAINHDRVRRLIPLGLMDEVAIVGSADMVRQRLNHYESIGVNNIFVPLPKEETILEYTTMISNIGGP